MPFDRVVGVVGLHAAGNDAVRELLERKLPAAGFVTSDCVREEAAARGLPPTRDNLYRVANEGRAKEGGGVWARRAWEKLEGSPERYAVIGGIRSPAEVETLRRLSDGRFVLIAVTAPLEVRWRRARARGRPGEGEISIEDFRAHEERELVGGPDQQDIAGALAMADRRLENDGTLGDLERKVDALVAELRKGER
jgi:dephospho-CoA kinase